jgi:spectinomycin phosphotransferase
VNDVEALPDGFDVDRLVPALQDGWGIEPDSVEYAPVGFGSYHWVVSTDGAPRYFVTVDDLDHKPWLGETRDSAFAGLEAAFDGVVTLRRDAGLTFVVAPLATAVGRSVLRIGERHSIAVFPFVDGVAGAFADRLAPAERTELVDLLAMLHTAAPTSAGLRVDVPFGGRSDLEAALRDSGVRWVGGPYSEPARAWLDSHRTELVGQLEEFDRLRAVTRSRARVTTHGEPHPGNVLRGDGGLVLIDWDTVALAPPERDLWMVAIPGGSELDQYAEATGHRVDENALEVYRRAWDLADVAAWVRLFRSDHRQDPDTDEAWALLTQAECLG